jgi:hypothetical protein
MSRSLRSTTVVQRAAVAPVSQRSDALHSDSTAGKRARSKSRETTATKSRSAKKGTSDEKQGQEEGNTQDTP